MPWPEVLHDFDCFTSVNPEFEPMRRLVYDLQPCASNELRATQVMGGGLLLSPEQQLHHNDNVLLVSFSPEEKRFHFEHRTISQMNDSQYSTVEGAWSTLRLFVAYKFGIRLPETRPNQAVQPTGASRSAHEKNRTSPAAGSGG
jgi:hypothetical protein